MKVVILYFWRIVGFSHFIIMYNKFSKGGMARPTTRPISRTIKHIYLNCIFWDCTPITVCWLTIFDTTFTKDSLTARWKQSSIIYRSSIKRAWNPILEELVTLNRYRNKPIQYVKQSFSSAKHDDVEFELQKEGHLASGQASDHV